MTWAHPKYSNIIATCGKDSKIKVWQETSGKNQKWDIIYEDELHSFVNCIAWAPWEYGLILAAGSASGKVHLYTKSVSNSGDNTSVQWKHKEIQAYVPKQEAIGTGVKSLSFAPSYSNFNTSVDSLLMD